MVFVNASSYGLYLVLAKDLSKKYHPITFIKWFYLFGLILVTPFGYIELTKVIWQKIPTNITTIKHFKSSDEKDFLSYGSSAKNLYLLLLEDL